jgi:hypothetical protein
MIQNAQNVSETFRITAQQTALADEPVPPSDEL